MPTLFGDKLRLLREQRGLTQQETAQLLGLARHGYVSNLETGKKEPSLEVVSRVAVAFRVSADYLLCDTEPPNPHPHSAEEQPYSLSHIGQNLLKLRRAAGLTQTEVALAVGLAKPGYISNIEKGRKFPSLSSIVLLARFFNVSTDHFLNPNR